MHMQTPRLTNQTLYVLLNMHVQMYACACIANTSQQLHTCMVVMGAHLQHHSTATFIHGSYGYASSMLTDSTGISNTPAGLRGGGGGGEDLHDNPLPLIRYGHLAL